MKDSRGTSNFDNKERAERLAEVECRYGYGSYTRADGAVRVGIEKMPLVKRMREKDLVYEMMLHEVEKRERKKKEEEEGKCTVKGCQRCPSTRVADEEGGRVHHELDEMDEGDEAIGVAH